MAGYLGGLVKERRRAPAGCLLSQVAEGAAGLPFDRRVKLPMTLVLGGWEDGASGSGTQIHVLLAQYEDHETAYGYLSAEGAPRGREDVPQRRRR